MKLSEMVIDFVGIKKKPGYRLSDSMEQELNARVRRESIDYQRRKESILNANQCSSEPCSRKGSQADLAAANQQCEPSTSKRKNTAPCPPPCYKGLGKGPCPKGCICGRKLSIIVGTPQQQCSN